MTETTVPLPAEVIQLHPEKPVKVVKSADAKWGTAVMQLGYCMIPSLLLRAQNRLKLTPTQLAVLMQLCDFWWERARKPYPSKDTLAVRLGMNARQVQRHLAALEEMKLIKRVPRFDAGHGGRATNIYDLDGLVQQLQQLEPEFRETEAEIRKRRQSIQRRNFRRSAATPRTASA